MDFRRFISTASCYIVLFCVGCSLSFSLFDTDKNLQYCVKQAEKTISGLNNFDSIPRSITQANTKWKMVNYHDWTSGFWPGILWYLFEYTGDTLWKSKAAGFSNTLKPLAYHKANDHDIGFQMFCSYGNGYRLTGDTTFKRILLASADTLATLFNPKVGTLLSWKHSVPNLEWPQHNTIIDNMMNLELLFWASKNGGSKKLYDIAVSHAMTTMKNHFRSNNTSYHVVVYDTLTGKKIKGVTHQGYSDSSMWARGQSWAIYGFTMVYRETKDPVFLSFAEKVADANLDNLRADLIPYWDFNDPSIPDAPRDASAAAIAASALLELSTLLDDKAKGSLYLTKARDILTVLSSGNYQSREINNAFLLHSTGHKPNGSEIDAAISYADYYYLEALLRLQKIEKKK